jgi:hypothetical protein
MRPFILALLGLILLEECVAKVTMEWSHVSASIKTKKGTKHLLTQACGKATPGFAFPSSPLPHVCQGVYVI